MTGTNENYRHIFEQNKQKNLLDQYSEQIYNRTYMLAALVKWAVLWGVSVYLGQQWWRSIDLDPKVNDVLATNSFNAMVFVMAFLFSGNLTNFIKTRDTWGDTVLELRHLRLYLVNAEERKPANDAKTSPPTTATAETVIFAACRLVLSCKTAAVVARQKADVVGTVLVDLMHGGGAFSVPDTTNYRKEFYTTCAAFLAFDTNPNKMARADALIKASYRAQYDMATPNVAASVHYVTSALLCFVSMTVAADQDTLYEAYIVTSATVGTIAIPFAVSVLVSSGSFSLFKSQFSDAIDPDFEESLGSILQTRETSQSQFVVDAPPRFYRR